MTSRRFWIPAAASSVLLIIFCYLYVDIPTALLMRQSNDSTFFSFFSGITILGQSEWYLVPGFLLFILFRNGQKHAASAGLFVFSTVALSGLAADLIKYILGRARPKLYLNDGMYGMDFFRWEHAWTSFPSGHSATAFSAAAALSLLFPRFRLFFFTAAILIAFSRIAINKHYISDVLAGSLLGLASTAFLYQRYFMTHCNAAGETKL
ncbi:phosphatase PAP2 family protein [Chlorobium phaeobacteroides]|jgi:membrane-associated phospholipid phosphatase|uniref:Phosphoesterase, PA-phosphatase related protein n=1 Tax=Chlorobium phaeobacteroides (strain DSM 266 / SMG 266 / 2430) TaxID=290317 RepID=A1BEB9_CHLPD|nr:phosphatase PAP2 family protein [Chlorobium phaeobacteroides]ABL64746.1 phosphoesterase, PA-phosphatase related protein [Chlorobium phaeobacteroides DSM 266]MBV5319418.1 phosphatase PAP2 family protein [Chlorobium phaeobacteroides]